MFGPDTVSEFAKGTSITYCRTPYRSVRAARALCPDGKTRACSSVGPHPDTYFSIPASVRVGRVTVRGFLMVETGEGFATATDSDPAIVKFCPMNSEKHKFD